MSDIDIAKVRRLDGGLLLIFRELLRRKKASEVADALGLSQSAVSHALGRLRDLFDDQLFVRRPHGFEPTHKATALAPRIEALVELASATLKAEGRFDPATTERRFRAVAPDFVAALVSSRLVQLTAEAAPKAWFMLTAAAHDAAFDMLKRGEIDMAIGRFGAARPGFEVEVLYEDAYCVVARKEHPDFRRKITLKQFREAGHVFSLAPGEGGEADDFDRSGGLRPLAVVPRWLTVLTTVAACDGIGTVPRRLAERHARVLGLAILDAPFVGDRLTISVARRAGLKDAGADWFLAQLRKAIG